MQRGGEAPASALRARSAAVAAALRTASVQQRCCNVRELLRALLGSATPSRAPGERASDRGVVGKATPWEHSTDVEVRRQPPPGPIGRPMVAPRDAARHRG